MPAADEERPSLVGMTVGGPPTKTSRCSKIERVKSLFDALLKVGHSWTFSPQIISQPPNSMLWNRRFPLPCGSEQVYVRWSSNSKFISISLRVLQVDCQDSSPRSDAAPRRMGKQCLVVPLMLCAAALGSLVTLRPWAGGKKWVEMEERYPFMESQKTKGRSGLDGFEQKVKTFPCPVCQKRWPLINKKGYPPGVQKATSPVTTVKPLDPKSGGNSWLSFIVRIKKKNRSLSNWNHFHQTVDQLMAAFQESLQGCGALLCAFFPLQSQRGFGGAQCQRSTGRKAWTEFDHLEGLKIKSTYHHFGLKKGHGIYTRICRSIIISHQKLVAICLWFISTDISTGITMSI